MGDVLKFTKKGGIDIECVFDDGKVVAVTHPDWPFRIMRKGESIALVCEETDEPFGELKADLFNTLLVCWLLIDDPDLIDSAANP